MQNRIKALETVKMEIANVERIIDGIENYPDLFINKFPLPCVHSVKRKHNELIREKRILELTAGGKE